MKPFTRSDLVMASLDAPSASASSCVTRTVVIAMLLDGAGPTFSSVTARTAASSRRLHSRFKPSRHKNRESVRAASSARARRCCGSG